MGQVAEAEVGAAQVLEAAVDRIKARPSPPAGVAVGGDHALVDAPGRLDLDVLLDGEQRLDPGGLLVGEQVSAGVQGPARVM